jgi:hypothetical protein
MLNNVTSDYQAELSSVPFGKLSSIINWCCKNCTDDWRYSILEEAGDMPGRYHFKFTNERDYINFLLFQQ